MWCEAHLTLISALVLLTDGEELQGPLTAPGGVEQLEPFISSELTEIFWSTLLILLMLNLFDAVSEDLIVGESDPGHGLVLHVGHTAV